MPSIIKNTDSGSDFELIPTGTHLATCVTVVNLGIQSGGQYAPKPKHYIGFEVPSVRVKWTKDGVEHEGPGIIGSRYTSSLSKKAILRQQLESWRGRAFTEQELEGFDLQVLLGKPCMISVVHTDDGKYANIAAILGVMKGTEVPPPETPLLQYDPTDANAAAELAALPEWMQKLINSSLPEPTEPSPPPQGDPNDFDDDIPF